MTLTMRPLEDYDISPVTGFLPSKPPLKRLTNEYFAPWENMMDNFNGLLLAGRLREKIHELPLLDANRLGSIEEYRRAFLILCLLSHAYVWGKLELASETLPSQLAVPWTKIADHLGLCPVVCHAAVALWNYRLLDEDGPIDLSNLAIMGTYSGSLDEAWFYLVTTSIESAGAPCVSQIMAAIDNIQDGNYTGLKANLETIRDSIAEMTQVLTRMYEKCDPYVFYWKIRPYLAGWENMAEAGLPLGLIYEGVDLWSEQTDEYADMSHLDSAQRLLRQYRRYAGGSAAQSSLIAALDVAFGVEHHRTGEKPTVIKPSELPADRYTKLPAPNPADELNGSAETPRTPPQFKRTNHNAFLRAMRKYMPRSHREFLEDLEVAANIRPFMLQLEEQHRQGTITEEEIELVEVYNQCLHQLKLFRDKHVQIVTLYIVNQARKGPNIPHGGFAIQQKKTEKTHSSQHNDLYPQTQLETAPGIKKDSKTEKVTQMFPQLGLARTIGSDSKVVRGTGGTNVMPFLKQSRDETNDMKIQLKEASTKEASKQSWSEWFLGR
ncbi:Indoleamine 2,3-dioxygenase [Rhizopus microsporus ATCC 52813]|uniref:Indoleamine 2,3-dioxygenase n=1 Tax=Rhizopus microsporus ATCC 52813 TaxID=1340429 RepID=A0A2G4SMY1_RHIZD|nr:Indoleamine 2,3-dioxygenase [Rhizopus microsporus ATCC 52813]PHZ10102.1 Indoleamine 2,3-dioxygenase [Rhizopus microsporus ATCC 52813]